MGVYLSRRSPPSSFWRSVLGFVAFRRIGLAATLALAGHGWFPNAGSGQTLDPAVREAFFRAVGDHFQVPPQEVALIGDWGLDPDEVPVVLFLAQRAGVTSDALVGIRRGGRAWRDVAARFGVGPQAFHISFPEDAPLGVLTRAMGLFRQMAARDWSDILLEDGELVALVNVRVLSQIAQVPPVRVLRCQEEARGFAACFPRLGGR